MSKTQSRWWDFPAIFFLFIAIWFVVWRIQATRWTSDLFRLETLTLAAYILGIFLGKSRFSNTVVRWLGLGYTLFFIPWQLGLVLGQNIEWTERLVSLWGRFRYSSGLFLSNQPVVDPILFLAAMSLLYWFLSITAGYLLVRYARPWVPLLVAAFALFIIDFYHPTFGIRSWFDGIFILFALLLVSRVYFLHSRREWDERGAVLDPEVGLNLGSTVLISGFIIILIAWNIPLFIEAFTPGTEIRERVQNAWTGLRNRLGNAVAGLRGTPVYEATTFSNQLGLGTGRILSDELLFTVQVSRFRTGGKRYYWRGYSYNNYSFGSWRSSSEYSQEVAPREWNFDYPLWTGRTRLTFVFTPESKLQRTIFSPTYPVVASRATRILLANEGNITDIVSLQTQSPLQPGEQFQLDAVVSNPTIAQMKAAPSEYPEWVTDRYLQLPPNFPERIHQLTINLTQDSPTQYDKVLAVTHYLRENIDFQEIIPSPPSDREPIDWFLFDFRKGFCNYYATAEIMMLRTVGIPARLSVGYAEGEGTSNGNVFQVYEKDSHAWPEVYFSNVGWVEFEPTSSLSPIFYPLGTIENESTLDEFERDRGFPQMEPPMIPSDDSRDVTLPVKQSLFSRLIASIILLFAISIFFWLAFFQIQIRPVPVMLVATMERWRIKVPAWLTYWVWRVERTPIEKLYIKLAGLLRFMGEKAVEGQTPSERINLLVKNEPSLQMPGGIFLDEYQLAIYSPHPSNYGRARGAYVRLRNMIISIWFRKLLKVK
jgi:transglutaminase-like putative cysteine protease